MTRTVSITEVSRHFSDYLNRVAYRGERFMLSRGKKILAELRPAPHGMRLSELPEIWRSLPHLSHEEADAFLKDLKQSNERLARQPLRSPWDS